MNNNSIDINTQIPIITCKVFKDNSSTLEMALIYRFRPQIKYIDIKLYHFCDYLTRGDILINAIDTSNQLVDYLTKLLTIEVL